MPTFVLIMYIYYVNTSNIAWNIFGKILTCVNIKDIKKIQRNFLIQGSLAWVEEIQFCSDGLLACRNYNFGDARRTLKSSMLTSWQNIGNEYPFLRCMSIYIVFIQIKNFTDSKEKLETSQALLLYNFSMYNCTLTHACVTVPFLSNYVM